MRPSQAANRSRAERPFWKFFAQGAQRKPVPICALQNGCRGATTAKIISQEFRRRCLHRQAGRTGISHCWSLTTGRSGDTHIARAALLHAKDGDSDRTAGGPWTRSEQGCHQKTQPTSGSWARCKLPASEERLCHFRRPAAASHAFCPLSPKLWV